MKFTFDTNNVPKFWKNGYFWFSIGMIVGVVSFFVVSEIVSFSNMTIFMTLF